MVLNPIKLFEGSFGGDTLWENKHYVTPNTVSWEILPQLPQILLYLT